MSSVAVRNNLSTCIEALSTGDAQALSKVVHETIASTEDAYELIGKVGLVAMRGDSDGHIVLTLGAASVLCRWLISLRHVLGDEEREKTLGVELVMQALLAAAPAVKAGKDAPQNYPQPLFPGELSTDEKAVSAAMHRAIFTDDINMV